MSDVLIVIGSGAIGLAIARRVGSGKKLVLADLDADKASALAAELAESGFDINAAKVDVTSAASVDSLIRNASEMGPVSGLVHAAGVSPSNAPSKVVFEVDLYGTALVLDRFGDAISRGGAALVISSQAGHRLDPLSLTDRKALATTHPEDLLGLPILDPERFPNSLKAYRLAKHAVALRVMAEAARWARRGVRLNCISPGIVMTPLAQRELSGPQNEQYNLMIDATIDGRVATPDEIGNLGAFLMGAESRFITGADILIDGGVTAAHWYGDLDLDW